MNALHLFDHNVSSLVSVIVSPTPVSIATTVALLPGEARRRRPRERDFGIGYGRSSGYGCTRRYASLGNRSLFRCG